jgi:hypothetical protein
MKFVVGAIMGLSFLTAVQAQALLSTESASYKCQSSDLSYVGQITFSKASRYSEITMNVCDGGIDSEPTNCHEETSYYEVLYWGC